MFCILLTTAVFTVTLIPGLVVSNVYKAQIALICLGFIGCYSIVKPRAVGVDQITFLGFSIISSVSLLLSKNLINIFFTLELINMLIIYSFFLNATSAKQVSENSALKISASCVYQFILNFFSSIILFVTINWFVSVSGGSDLTNGALLQADESVKLPLSILIAAFLLKFGSGPWIFFKVSIYKNLNYVSVFMYTSMYLLVIFIFFLNLIFINGITPNATAVYTIAVLAISGTAIFSNLAFQQPNVFVFLSFSSLINITIFLLQALTVINVWIAQE